MEVIEADSSDVCTHRCNTEGCCVSGYCSRQAGRNSVVEVIAGKMYAILILLKSYFVLLSMKQHETIRRHFIAGS